MYISLTGLKPKNFWAYLKFWRLAIPSFAQAQAAKGNISVSAKRINGYQCTVSAWESREVMLDFMRSGAHLNAMKHFHSIATGRTFGYESELVPNPKEAFALLMEKGKDY